MSVLPALQLAKRWCTTRACGRAATVPRPSTTSPRTPCASRTSRTVECVGSAAAGGGTGAQPARAAGPRPRHAQATRARGHPAPHARAGQLSVLEALQLAKALARSPRVRQGRDRATPSTTSPRTPCASRTSRSVECVGGAAAGGSAGAQSAGAAGPRPRHAQAPRARGHPAPHARAGQLSVLEALQLAEALARSPRVRQGRDRATPKHHEPADILRLTHEQVS
ncbi:unnamed protein product [Parnassius apollo]|uniref:(apollo) hypothetical protein n=1 Tax=Parnassius apollo TaxID=110799 RepID=A0A8S3X8I6_PARAO|nr:unnamed protein product [Parnassius apollo]